MSMSVSRVEDCANPGKSVKFPKSIMQNKDSSSKKCHSWHFIITVKPTLCIYISKHRSFIYYIRLTVNIFLTYQ